MTCYGAVQKVMVVKTSAVIYISFNITISLFTIQGCIVQRTSGPLGQLLMITCPVLLTGLAVLFQMPYRLCHSAACDYMCMTLKKLWLASQVQTMKTLMTRSKDVTGKPCCIVYEECLLELARIEVIIGIWYS